jgi:hypothetical protein
MAPCNISPKADVWPGSVDIKSCLRDFLEAGVACPRLTLSAQGLKASLQAKKQQVIEVSWVASAGLPCRW